MKKTMLEIMALAQASQAPAMIKPDGFPSVASREFVRRADAMLVALVPALDVMVDRWGVIYVGVLGAHPLTRDGWQLSYGGTSRMTADDAADVFCAQIAAALARGEHV
jgi:hypothetical protein